MKFAQPDESESAVTHAPVENLPRAILQPVYSISMKILARCPHQSLPLLVRVKSAAREGDHVVYHCAITNKVSNASWTVSYRYSQLFAFKTQVEKRWTCKSPKCSGSCRALRDYIDSCFPPKRLLGSTSQRSIDERKAKLGNVLLHLLRSVLFSGSAISCVVARTRLPRNLLQLLGVNDSQDGRSVLQIFVDSYQAIVKRQLSVAATGSEDSASSCTVEVEQCAFCMNDLTQTCCATDTVTGSSNGQQAASVTLPCTHTFHRTCVFEWLMFKSHCPVCRSHVGPPAVTSICRPKKRTQWWVGDYEQDPVRSHILKPYPEAD